MAIVEAAAEGVFLNLRVRTGSQRQGIVGAHDGALKVHVHAAPEGGKANKSVVAVLAKSLGVAKSDMEIVAGATSPQKRLRLAGADEADIRRRLDEILAKIDS